MNVITEWTTRWQIKNESISEIASSYQENPRVVAVAIRTCLALLDIDERDPEELTAAIIAANKADALTNNSRS